jgi:apolipoprotein N-acyltransferase
VISPPLGWIWLHPISWVPALFVFSRCEGRRALLAGWIVGTSAQISIFHWLAGTVTRYGDIPLPLSLLILLLFAAATGFYTAVFAWGFARVRRVAGARWPFAMAAWFAAVEYLNPQIFGYLQGVAWYQVPEIFLVVAVTGVTGVSFLVMLFNAVALQALQVLRGEARETKRALVANTAGAFALLAVAVGYSNLRLDAIERAERDADPLRVALVQPNHTIERRRELHRLGLDAFANEMVALSRAAIEEAAFEGETIDVFVWPEGALRADPSQASNRAVKDFVRESGAEVWTGANHHEIGPKGTPISHNSAFRILGDGTLDRRYDKNILVPFGEYVPFEDIVPGFDRIPTVANFERGHDIPRYASGPARFVFLICYEAIRSGFVRRALDDDTNLIVNVTVDAWYGDTSEQSQHLMLAATQSALHGLPLLRATTTGISAIVDARGAIVEQTDTFTSELIVREIRPLRVSAPYSSYGDGLAWIFVASSVFLLGVSASRSRRARA